MSTYQKTSLVSVDEAIAKGRSMLLLPRILMIAGLFFFLFPVALFIMALTDGPPFSRMVWLISAGVILFCFLLFFLLPFLYWSKTTTRWKLWAFDNVDNIHDLKLMALDSHLYPAYGSVMEKLQIQSAAEREQWHKLQSRFDFPEVFIDDPRIPAKTLIYFSNAQQVVKIILGLFFMAVGWTLVYFISRNNNEVLPLLISVAIGLIPLLLIVSSVKRMRSKEPQLVLDDRGFYSKSTGFLEWDLIYDQRVETIHRARRGVKYVLKFQYPGGLANIDITELAVTKGQLLRLMRFYKGRFKA